MLKIIKLTFATNARLQTLLVLSESAPLCRRWAGHSKWANIKHQKSANDAEKTKTFTRLVRMIKVAITEHKNSDPNTNSQLQNVIGQCRRANMPVTTIANAIKGASISKGPDEVSSTLQIRGPGRCALLVDVASSNLSHFKNQTAAVMKKHGCAYEKAVAHDYSQKGVLLASPLPDSTNILDDATDHAISVGVEDVTLDEQTRKLRFECSPELTWKAKKALEEQGYVIDSAIVEFLPVNLAQLTDDQMDLLQKFITKVEAMPEVLKVTDNVE